MAALGEMTLSFAAACLSYVLLSLAACSALAQIGSIHLKDSSSIVLFCGAPYLTLMGYALSKTAMCYDCFNQWYGDDLIWVIVWLDSRLV